MARLISYLRRHHVALLALFIALGGTSYAAVKLPKGSVGAKQLQENAVVSAKVRDGSLLAQDFKPGQLPAGAAGIQGLKGEAGQQGDPGERGLTGPQGPGAVSLTYSTQVNVTDVKLGSVGPWEIWAECDHQGGTNFLLLIGGPGTATYQVVTATDDTAGPVVATGTTTLSATGIRYIPAFQITGYPANHERLAGTLVLRSGATAAHVHVEALADYNTTPNGTCSAVGVAVPAT
ncbi:MAG: hypothetical protein QOF17_905 [Solirubrobacteraceae bacterium]|nr:hypothetical protein [Solirubrobacteraceae bacterium]